MKTCPNCGNEQESGAFCGKCGGKLEITGAEATTIESQVNANSNQATTEDHSTATQTHTEHTQAAHNQAASTVHDSQRTQAQGFHNHQQANPTAEAIKAKSQAYGSFFKHIIGNPTRAVHLKEKDFTNGLISILLYILTFSLSIYFLVNSFYKSFMGEMLPADLLFRSIFLVAIIAVIALGSMMAMAKMNQSAVTFKELLTKYGALSVPFIALNVFSILTALASGYVITLIVLSFSSIVFLYVLPALLVFAQKPGNPQKDQRVYASIGTVALAALANYMLFTLMVQEMILNIENLVGFGF